MHGSQLPPSLDGGEEEKRQQFLSHHLKMVAIESYTVSLTVRTEVRITTLAQRIYRHRIHIRINEIFTRHTPNKSIIRCATT